jgi:hypothetical protein
MKESSIFRMDWRSLGYWPVYKDGRLVWEKNVKSYKETSEN